jgi:hypothetical protein
MRLIDAAQRVSEATDSYDFIYSVTTLFAQLRLYLLGTPGAQDSRVQDHGDLYRSVAHSRCEPLHSGFVGG